MRVWHKTPPPNPALSGSEGNLVSVSISVDPRYLESLLEALSQINFPINPQIYHDAATVYVYPDQHEESVAVTLVEFPAYAGQLKEVSDAIRAFGFDPSNIRVSEMLDEIRSECLAESVPPGAGYVSRYRIKRRAASVH